MTKVHRGTVPLCIFFKKKQYEKDIFDDIDDTDVDR